MKIISSFVFFAIVFSAYCGDLEDQLFSACNEGNTELVRVLISKGAKVNSKNNEGQTPLFCAILRNDLESAKLLIEKGADVNIAANDGRTPLSEASKQGHSETVIFLFSQGAAVPAGVPSGAGTESRIVNKVLCGKTRTDSISGSEKLKLILEEVLKSRRLNGGEANAEKILRNLSRKMPLDECETEESEALDRKREQMAEQKYPREATKRNFQEKARKKYPVYNIGDHVSFTYSNGLFVSGKYYKSDASYFYIGYKKVPKGQLPEHIYNRFNVKAATENQKKYVSEQMENFEKIRSDYASGLEPDKYAQARGLLEYDGKWRSVREVVEIIMKEESRIKEVALHGKSAEHSEKENQFAENKPVEEKSSETKRPRRKRSSTNVNMDLLRACDMGNAKQANRLISQENADVNAQLNDGRSALFLAAEAGYLDVVEILVENGAIVNVPAKDGRTPLFAASERGHLDVVKILVENGADINLTANDHRSPMYAASRNGHQAIVHYLAGKGGKILPEQKPKISQTVPFCEFVNFDRKILKIDWNMTIAEARAAGFSRKYPEMDKNGLSCYTSSLGSVHLFFTADGRLACCTFNDPSYNKYEGKENYLRAYKDNLQFYIQRYGKIVQDKYLGYTENRVARIDYIAIVVPDEVLLILTLVNITDISGQIRAYNPSIYRADMNYARENCTRL